MPTTPASPHATLQARSGPEGTGSPRTPARPRATNIPTSCVPATTPNSGARRASRPPPKSPPPQASADRRPRRTTADPAGRRSGRGGALGFDVGVGGRGPVQDHDLVRQVVVAVGGGQVDDLEVRRDLPEELEGAGGP